MEEFLKYGLGYAPDEKDDRDHLWRQAVLLTKIPLPPRFVRKRLGRVLNQGEHPHCVAYSAATLKMHQEKREHGSYLDFDPNWLYSECKKRDGIPRQDGTFLRVALQILNETGYLLKDKSASYKIEKYVRLTSVQQIKEAVYTVGPVVFGITVDTGIYNPNASGIIPQPNDDTVGGHAMTICGYDDNKACGKTKGAFLIKNSWGTDYGLKGYVWMPYSHFTAYNDFDAWRTVDAVDP